MANMNSGWQTTTPSSSSYTTPSYKYRGLGMKELPAYLLDMKEWTIRNLPDILNEEKDKKEFEDNGFGIVSYAWGRWHNKTKRGADTTISAEYPKFNIGKRRDGSEIKWIFPVVNKIEPTDDKVFRTFKDDFAWKPSDMKKVLENLGTRFVWWDWACIPQGWKWDENTEKGMGPEYHVPAELRIVANQEVNKMRFFYPASKAGVLWWWSSEWSKPSDAPKGKIQELFDSVAKIRLGQPLIPVQAKRTGRPRAFASPPLYIPKPTKGRLSYAEAEDFSTAWRRAQISTSEEASGQSEPPGNFPGLDGMEVFVTQLEAVRESELSLQSVWSFQEAVLFSNPTRPIPEESTNPAQSPITPSAIVDFNGARLLPSNEQGPSASERQSDPMAVFRYGFADLMDLSSMVTLMAAVLAKPIMLSEIPGALKKGEREVFIEGDKKSRSYNCLSKLIKTGFVTLSFDNPVPLLVARFGRTAAKWNSDLDVCVRSLQGALGIDLSDAIPEAQKLKDAAEATVGLSANDKKNAGEAAEFKYMRDEFLKGLIRTYQWRLLLFAREHKATGPQNAAPGTPVTTPSESIWESLIGRNPPRIAALEIYLGADGRLSQIYSPNISVENPAIPDGVDKNLPSLQISSDNNGTFLAAAVKKEYQWWYFPDPDADSEQKGWDNAVVYKYQAGDSSGSSQLSGIVVAQPLLFERRSFLSKDAGVALLPLEEIKSEALLGVTAKRCAILTNVTKSGDGEPYKAIYWGLGDFVNIQTHAMNVEAQIQLF